MGNGAPAGPSIGALGPCSRIPSLAVLPSTPFQRPSGLPRAPGSVGVVSSSPPSPSGLVQRRSTSHNGPVARGRGLPAHPAVHGPRVHAAAPPRRRHLLRQPRSDGGPAGAAAGARAPGTRTAAARTLAACGCSCLRLWAAGLAAPGAHRPALGPGSRANCVSGPRSVPPAPPPPAASTHTALAPRAARVLVQATTRWHRAPPCPGYHAHMPGPPRCCACRWRRRGSSSRRRAASSPRAATLSRRRLRRPRCAAPAVPPCLGHAALGAPLLLPLRTAGTAR